MNARWWSVVSSAIALLVFLGSDALQPVSRTAAPRAVGAPVLQWQHAGCTSGCETGWYSSPAVADLDGDGATEVIGSAYALYVLDGATGSLVWRVASGHDRSEPGADNVGRTWPGIVVADIDGDGSSEIASAHSGGYVSVYDHTGYMEPGWPQQPTTNELRGLSAYDLDGDGTMEIVVTGAVYTRTNTWVFEHSGVLRAGWPQLNNDSGYAWGMFTDNAGVGDVDGDGMGEIVAPSDVHYVCAYEQNGVQIPANAMYGDKAWGKVGVHVDHAVDLRGYANCDNPPHPPLEPRPNFANSAATIADLNGDGEVEVIVVGNNYDCRTRPYTDLYEMPYVFRADRSRWSGSGYDWTAIPVPDMDATPLSEDWHEIESNQPNPVAADLDGDGEREILYASYDGRVHAYWLDKTEHHAWPFEVHTSGPYRFASEPVVVDLDDNGQAEVIFASWVQKETGLTGKLHILSYQGTVLYEVDLPAAYSSGDTWNGVLAAPTVANIDGDGNFEVVLNTAHAGFVAYELPGTQNARVLWGTGRGNYQRTGSILHGSLNGSSKRVEPLLPEPGETMTYTITLRNPGPALPGARVTDTLPVAVSYAGGLWASAGSWGHAGGVITWTGTVPAGVPVTLRYGVTLDEQVTDPQVIVNAAQIDDGLGDVYERRALAIANGHAAYLPAVQRLSTP